MSRWWRAYDGAVDDPKLCLLSDKQHRAWFNLCCITSQNDGKLPPIAAVAFKLHMTVQKAKSVVAELVALKLIDMDDGTFTPHNWNARQYKSDVTDPTTANRSKRYRDKKRDVDRDEHRDATVTVTDTREQIQTTETEQKDISSLRSEPVPAKPKVPRAKPKHPLPDLWQMDDQDFNYATDQGFKPDKIRQMSRAFSDHHRAKATLSADWHASWRTWCGNEIKFNGGGNGNRTGNQKTSGHDAILAVANRKARELDRNDDVARPADATGFAFGNGSDGSGSRGNPDAIGSDQRDHHRGEPDSQRIREGEIIPPDKNAAGVPRSGEFI